MYSKCFLFICIILFSIEAQDMKYYLVTVKKEPFGYIQAELPDNKNQNTIKVRKINSFYKTSLAGKKYDYRLLEQTRYQKNTVSFYSLEYEKKGIGDKETIYLIKTALRLFR